MATDDKNDWPLPTTNNNSDSGGFQTQGELENANAVWESMKILTDAHLLARQNLLHQDRMRRAAERQSNEYRDQICSLQRRVHLLENIKRVSQDYIHCQKQLVNAMDLGEHAQKDILRHSLDEFENELYLWQNKLKAEQSLNISVSFHNSSVSNSNASQASTENHKKDRVLPNTFDEDLSKSNPITVANLAVDSPTQLPDYCISSMEVENGDNTVLNCFQLSYEDTDSKINGGNNELPNSSLALSASALDFNSEENLEAKNENLSGEKYKLQCSVEGCDYKYRLKSQLKVHELKHIGIYQFYCDAPSCTFSTNYKNNLKKHQVSHHEKPGGVIPTKKLTGVKKPTTSNSISEFTCGIRDCKFVTRSKKNWQNHQRKHVKPLVASTTPTKVNMNETEHDSGE